MSGAADQQRGSPEATFDPRLLVFACNWCSYAGADTAGVSRLAQTPHFRLLRVMCSGRVHPAFVLRAFARGADGVMVSGCHFGDCHYLFGNHRAAEQHAKTEALIELLGLGRERLRLEWISAAEGARFADTMNAFAADVRAAGRSPIAPDGEVAQPETSHPAASSAESSVFACLECGRCTAVCPVARHQSFSPRRLISRALAAGAGALQGDPALWTCLTCNRCQSVCPLGIDYPRFILAARAEALSASEHERPPASAQLLPCSHGGVFEQVSRIAARPNLRQNRLAWLTPDLRVEIVPEGGRAAGRDLLFVGCSPYFAAYFGGSTGTALTTTLRSVVRLLNRAGLEPALLANERCCAYPLRLAGRSREADELEQRVHAQIRASGCSRVITFCPECLIALREIAGRHGSSGEIAHLSQVLWERRAAWQTETTPAAPGCAGRVTFQDPCRLGRCAGLYDPPRRLLTEMARVDVVEMERSREQALCCGNTAWLHCDAATRGLQLERLTEASATGCRQLVTACPGCFIHLSCAQAGLEGHPAADVEIVDIWNLLAGATHARRLDAAHERGSEVLSATP